MNLVQSNLDQFSLIIYWSANPNSSSANKMKFQILKWEFKPYPFPNGTLSQKRLLSL
jgi:hypothetical protein